MGIMPIRIKDGLPAAEILGNENIFVMLESRATKQEIRPLQVVVLNLMPKKIETENQILRLLSNTPLQVNVELLRIDYRASKNTPQEHIDEFYHDFERIRHNNYDGLIITGAPLGLVGHDDVVYWPQIEEIINWSKTHVVSTLFLCWAAQAALKVLHGVDKKVHEAKFSGVYPQQTFHRHNPLVRGFDDEFSVPMSRYANFSAEMFANTDINILAANDETGVYLAASKDCRQVFVTGHPEYSADTLHQEYMRDIADGVEAEVPANYYKGNDAENAPRVTWRSHGNLLYSNWLNYYVYQQTPYDLNDL
ncbi:MAG: homoserine O-succinyltransferase [Moritella sp.]|jgi:homoserine O-succinyltransferase